MSRMLVNGCSYAHRWGYATKDLGDRLGYDETVNIAIPASSNERIFRTTVNYILENPVDLVVVGLTFWQRSESPFARNIPIEGPWISYGNHTLNFEYLERIGITLDGSRADMEQYVKHKLVMEWRPDYIDKMLTDLLCFTGWLKSRGIKYCVFGSCDMQYNCFTTPPAKKEALLADPCIINIFNWSSNKFLHENGAEFEIEDQILDPLVRHYEESAHRVLNDYLYEYITNNCL